MAEEESHLLNALVTEYLTKEAPDTARQFQLLLASSKRRKKKKVERSNSGEEKVLKFSQLMLNIECCFKTKSRQLISVFSPILSPA